MWHLTSAEETVVAAAGWASAAGNHLDGVSFDSDEEDVRNVKTKVAPRIGNPAMMGKKSKMEDYLVSDGNGNRKKAT